MNNATESPTGEWRWYCGSQDNDDEMQDCGTRAAAIRLGCREYEQGESFYIVEARMKIMHESAMSKNALDAAPFAQTRNGEWVVSGITGDIDQREA